MSVPVKHHSHGKVGRRRSHLALKQTSLQACTACKAPVLPHRVCGFCGAVQTRATRGARTTKKTKASRARTAPVAAEAPAVAEAVPQTEQPAPERSA